MITKELIIILFSVVYVFEILISLLSIKAKNKKVIEELLYLYDEKALTMKNNYTKERSYLVLFKKSIDYVVLLLLFIFNGYGKIAFYIKTEEVYYYIIVPLIYFCVMRMSDMFFKYFVLVKINPKYGFNKVNMRTFIFDEIKSFIIKFVIIVSVTYSMTYLFYFFDTESILTFMISLIVSEIVFVTLTPFFQRFNNKFVPLEEGPLKDKIKQLAEEYGFKIKKVKVLLTAKRGYKVNAYMTGLGYTKTIVLYDSLFSLLKEDEIIAIFAHELAHAKKHHMVINMIMNLLKIFGIVFISYLFIRNIYQTQEEFFIENGFYQINPGFIYVVVVLTILPILKYIINIPFNYILRTNEYNADKFACSLGYAKELKRALLKQSRATFGSLNENKFVVALLYTHPPLSERIINLNKQIDHNSCIND